MESDCVRQMERSWGIGTDAVEPLLVLLKKDRYLRKRAVEALGEIKDARAIGPLIHLLADPNPNSHRGYIAEVLGKIDPGWRKSDAAQTAVPALISAFAETPMTHGAKSHSEILWAAKAAKDAVIWAMGEIGDQRFVGFLANAIVTESDRYGMRIIVEALRKIGDTHAVMPLVRLARVNKEISYEAVSELEKILDTKASTVLEGDLRSIAQLSGVVAIVRVSVCEGYSYYENVDCSRVRQLARQEMIRRGLEA